MKTATAIALATALLSAAPALAKDEEHGLSKTDQRFVEQASKGNMTEVHLGALAAAQGTTPAIREFGRWMISTHSFANRELATIVGRMHGENPPSDLGNNAQESMAKLEGLHGKEFDKAYLQIMEEDHEKDVETMSAEAKNGDDYLVKTFAANVVPAVKEHLAQIKLLIADMNGSGQESAAKDADMKAASGGMTGPAQKPTGEAETVRKQHAN